jgi:xanthine dehydrogenase YagT iron-sulfur-binding subunit
VPVKKQPDTGLNRRDFLKTFGSGALATGLVGHAAGEPQAATELHGPEAQVVTLKVNGRTYRSELEPRVTLLSALRDHLDLTGTKLVCDRGACGACTVLLDGQPVLSCMRLAIEAQGHAITTVEGLAEGEQLHPVQQAFIEQDAMQCGFCTPGLVMASVALLQAHPNPSPQQIREGLSGNLCRCGTYPKVFEAVEAAARKMKG